MTLEDIGEGDDALLCITNLSGSGIRNWFFPDGSRVSSSENVNTTFYRTRSDMVVILNYKRGGVDGIYHCEIPHSMNATQTIYIGVYTANSGKYKNDTLLFYSTIAIL